MNKTYEWLRLSVLSSSMSKLCLGGAFLTIAQVFFIGKMAFDITPNFIGTLLVMWAISNYSSHHDLFKKSYLQFKLLTIWFVIAFVILLFAFVGEQIVWFNVLYMWIDFIATHYALYLIIRLLNIMEKDAGCFRRSITWYVAWIILTVANMCSIIASQATVIIGPISQSFVVGIGTMILLALIFGFLGTVILLALFYIAARRYNRLSD